MAYVNKQNLSDFWTNAKRYIAARDADQCDWTSIPVNASSYRFEAEPRTPVNPVIEFSFTETPPAEGEKGLDNPSTITGVDSITVTRYGKNILPSTPVASAAMTDRGVTVTTNSDGSIHLQGTVTANIAAYLTYFNNTVGGVVPEELAIAKTVTVSLKCSDSNVYGALYRSNSASAWGSPITIPANSETTYTVTPDIKSAMFRIVANGGSVLNCDVYCQIEYGSKATAWEPPAETITTVSLGKTRYGGTLDVATGKMTVTHRCLVFNGNEAEWYTNNQGSVGGFYRHVIPITDFKSTPNVPNQTSCTHFNCIYSWGGAYLHYYNAAEFIVFFTQDTNIDDFKAFLSAQYNAGHPVTVVYPFATPITIDLDPQQLFSALSNSKANTVFTDTGTIIQLTYAKSAPSQEDVFRYANWHGTESAGAVTCCPVPESELHPVVNFSFTETPPAEGEKGLDNPSTITGVGSVNVGCIGKNLVRYISPGTFSNNGVDFTVARDGSITVSGTAGTGNSNYDLSYLGINTYFDRAIPVIAGHTYTVSGCPSGGSTSTYCMFGAICDKSGHAIAYNILNDTGSGRSYTPSVDGYIFLRITITAGYTASNLVFSPQIEESSTATSYESPERSIYAIPLNGTYYGGSIDLKTGLMTVTWVGVVYDGTENITRQTDLEDGTPQYNLPLSEYNDHTANVACTHFPVGYTNGSGYVRGSGGAGFRVFITGFETVEALKAWVAGQYSAGTPVTVVYKPEASFTVQLTPQQIKALPALDRHEPRINTLYTDADSIQVSYQKSPIQTELELTDAILALGGGE